MMEYELKCVVFIMLTILTKGKIFTLALTAGIYIFPDSSKAASSSAEFRLDMGLGGLMCSEFSWISNVCDLIFMELSCC